MGGMEGRREVSIMQRACRRVLRDSEDFNEQRWSRRQKLRQAGVKVDGVLQSLARVQDTLHVRIV